MKRDPFLSLQLAGYGPFSFFSYIKKKKGFINHRCLTVRLEVLRAVSLLPAAWGHVHSGVGALLCRAGGQGSPLPSSL